MFTEIEMQIEDFMQDCELRNLSKKTLKAYEQTLKLFAKYLQDSFKVTEIKNIQTEMLQKYIKFLQTRGKYTVVTNDNSKDNNNPQARKDFGKKINTQTINNYIRVIKVFFHWLKQRRIIKKDITEPVKYLKYERKAVEFIEDDDFFKILKCFDTTKFVGYRDYIITELLFDTGMRLGECLAIKVDDIDLKNRTIHLLAENTKGRKDRFVFYSTEMGSELKRWIIYKDRYVDSEYLFCSLRGTFVKLNVYEHHLKEAAKKAGIENIHPHMIRNNFAKRCLMEGMDLYTLAKVLGHTSVTTTEKAYLDLTVDDIRKNYNKYSPLEKMKKKWR
ncbi:tyrosine-type recombinase/integrase [Thermoanaerobacterium thermosulfurigenes]|uniref:tyrosine-type recombinase/integrase n=1 Tax=Thermoanaerobacterium thermosulfurigenes TaxID=33950 RepID=UPI003EF15B8A